MIETLEILIISIVQGIGEFLPISSSGHIAVTEAVFDRFGVPLAGSEADFIKLNVLLHLGTLLAVLVVFRKRILDLFGKDLRLIPLLIVGTLPAVVIGLSVKKNAPWIMQDLNLIAICFLVTGGLLLTTSRRKDQDDGKTCSEMSWTDALFIGVFQSIAILPGISRSGSTIVAGLFRKLRRDEAATFSFLLSIPVIGGAGVLELKDLFEVPAAEQSLSPTLLVIGMLSSCVVGIFALLWLLNWLQKGKLWYFALWVFLMCPLTFLLASIPTNSNAGTSTDTPDVVATAVDDSGEANAADTTKEETTKTDWPFPPGKIAQFGRPLVDPDNVMENKSDEKPTVVEPDALPSGLSKLEKPIQPTKSLVDAVENVEDSGRLNMSQEEALKEYERILAEEEAKELAFIEEEQKRQPEVENPEDLVLLFPGPKDRVWITKNGSVVVLGRVALREGLLELFACRIGTKEHESIVSIRLTPHLIHAALLAVGAEPGKPVQVTPTFVPPSGEEIEIRIRWKDDNGNVKEVDAREWVWDAGNSKENDKKTMTTPWVFTGSMTYRDEMGENHYVADESGELVGLSNFVGAILDVPIESSADNSQLLFACFTERIPEIGTPLTIIVTPKKNRRK